MHPPIWSTSYLNDLLNEAEVELSEIIKCIIFRTSISVTAGNAEYDLPDGIIGILQVTWKGEWLDSLELDDFKLDSYIKPQSLSSQNKPRVYMRMRNGYKKIKFLPTPDETIASTSNPLDSTEIENRVIVTAYRSADTTANTYRLPSYIYRRFTKYYVLYRAFLQEGKGQDLKASEYFKNKYEFIKQRFKEINEKIPRCVDLGFGYSSQFSRGRTPPRPVLPTTGNWSF